MKKFYLVCDCCGKEERDEKSDPVMAIGAFMGKMEIQVRTSFHQGGIGISRWQGVDLCNDCKTQALKGASQAWLVDEYREHRMVNWKDLTL